MFQNLKQRHRRSARRAQRKRNCTRWRIAAFGLDQRGLLGLRSGSVRCRIRLGPAFEMPENELARALPLALTIFRRANGKRDAASTRALLMRIRAGAADEREFFYRRGALGVLRPLAFTLKPPLELLEQ